MLEYRSGEIQSRGAERYRRPEACGKVVLFRENRDSERIVCVLTFCKSFHIEYWLYFNVLRNVGSLRSY